MALTKMIGSLFCGGVVLLFGSFMESNGYFLKIVYDLTMKKFIAIALSFLISSCAVSLGNTDNMQRTVVSNLTPEYACIINHHYSHHGEEVPTDIRVYLEVTDTNCEVIGKHSEKKPMKAFIGFFSECLPITSQLVSVTSRYTLMSVGTSSP